MASTSLSLGGLPMATASRPACRATRCTVVRAQAAQRDPAQPSTATGLACAFIGAAASLNLMASPAIAAEVPEATVRATQEIGKPSPPPKQSSAKSEEPEKVSPVRSALNGLLGREGPIGTPAAPNTTAGGGSTGLAERR